MELESLLGVLGLVGTLAGSLGGVALAQRHERKMARLERAESRRNELRGHVVAFLAYADEWFSQYEVVIFLFWKSSADDFVLLSNSEMVTRAGDIRRSVTGEITHLIGLVGDDRLRAAIYAFHDLWVRVPDDVMGPVTDDRRKNDDKAPAESMRAIRELQKAALEIRNASLPLLTVAVNEPEPVRWWQVRKRRAISPAKAG